MKTVVTASWIPVVTAERWSVAQSRDDLGRVATVRPTEVSS